MTNTTIKRVGAGSVLSVGVVMGVLLCAPALAMAQTAQDVQPDPASPSIGQASEVGRSTVAWLDLQRSGAQAAPALPTLGSEAGLAYKRYMESFKSRIPDLYTSTLGGSSGSGSNGSGGASGGMSGAGGSN